MRSANDCSLLTSFGLYFLVSYLLNPSRTNSSILLSIISLLINVWTSEVTLVPTSLYWLSLCLNFFGNNLSSIFTMGPDTNSAALFPDTTIKLDTWFLTQVPGPDNIAIRSNFNNLSKNDRFIPL